MIPYFCRPASPSTPAPTPSAPAATRRPQPSRKAKWLKTLHQWHWISSAVCLMGLLLFAVTGFTLNHASQIESAPQVGTRSALLPPALRPWLAQGPAEGRSAQLPAALHAWAATALGADVAGREAEWSEAEVYVALPRPGGDAWLRVDRRSFEAEAERTDRGWVSYLNDLHKGRHTGAAWSWFIDVFALATLVFSLSGLLLLKLHAAKRRSTWPVVALGLVIPLLLALMH